MACDDPVPASTATGRPSRLRRATAAATGVAAAALDLAVPGRCAGCDAPGPAVCAACADALTGPARLAPPDPSPPGLPPVWAVASYAGPVRAVLLAHKEHGRLGLVRPLGDAMALCVAAALGPYAAPGPYAAAPLVVPVPSTRSAVRARGHDPVARTVRRAVRRLRAAGRPAVAAPVLRHSRHVGDQAGLDAAQRQDNLAGALRVPPGWARVVAGRVVVVADDVVTTGATLVAAAAALRAAGAVVVGAAVVAATARRVPVTQSNDYRALP